MKVYFAEPASIEFDDAFEYYELQLPGLGEKFETIELISQFPQLWSQNSEHTRKAVLRKFPPIILFIQFLIIKFT